MSVRWVGGDLERAALGRAKASLVAGKGADEVAVDLAEAAQKIRAARTVFCDHCGAVIRGPVVQDPEQVAWLGAGAQTFCSPEGLIAWEEERINAAGGEPS